MWGCQVQDYIPVFGQGRQAPTRPEAAGRAAATPRNGGGGDPPWPDPGTRQGRAARMRDRSCRGRKRDGWCRNTGRRSKGAQAERTAGPAGAAMRTRPLPSRGRRMGDPATRRPGDPATRRPGDPATRRPGDPATRRPGDPATRRPGDPATRRPGDPATRRPGDPATRRPGDPATIIAVASSPFVNPELPIAETAAPSAAQALFTYPIMVLSLLCVGATAPPKVEGRRVSHSGLPPFTTAATAREALEPRAVRPRPP